MARNFYNGTVIHPTDCPCEHCLLDDTVPLDIFVRKASLEDVISVMLYEIVNETHYDEYWLIRHMARNSKDKEVQRLSQIYP